MLGIVVLDIFYLHILSVKSEENIKKTDKYYLTPKHEIPSAIIIDFLQRYSPDVKRYLIDSLNLDKMIESTKAEIGLSIKAALEEKLKTKIDKGLES
jgi:hypothetical protein